MPHQMRQLKSTRQEEGFFMPCLQLLNTIIHSLIILHIFIGNIHRSPVQIAHTRHAIYGMMIGACAGMRLIKQTRHIRIPRHWIGKFAVIYLATTRCEIAILPKMLRQCHAISSRFRKSERLSIVINTRSRWSQPTHQTRPRRIANRCLTIRAFKYCTPLGQPVKMRGHSIRCAV